MREFKLTHFDQVWAALSDPANMGLAEAYRVHFHHAPSPGDAQGAAAAQLNFLLDRCGISPIEVDAVDIEGAVWRVKLPSEAAAQDLQTLARRVVETAAPHLRTHTGVPTVARDRVLKRWLASLVDAVTGPRSTPRAPALPVAGEPPARGIQQGLPYDVNAPIPGDAAAGGRDAAGTGLQRGRPYALPGPLADRGHYTQVEVPTARAPEAPARGLSGP